jgi:hypothetical protein
LSDGKALHRNKSKEQIGQQTSPALAEPAAGRFSGTKADAAVAFDITLMAATREYFGYWGSVMCGMPEITLEGSPDGWAQMALRPIIGWAILDTGEKPDAADAKRYEKHQEKTSSN